MTSSAPPPATPLPPAGPGVTMEDLWAAPTVYRSDLYAGQQVLVTGGGTGIGRAIALLFARLGARVAICGRTQAKLGAVVAFAEARGATMAGIATDIREPEQLRTLFERIEAQWAPVDIVINNAGGSTRSRPSTSPPRAGTRSSTTTSTPPGT